MTIETTHVGSLPRTQKVVDFIFAREQQQPFEQAAFDAAMTAALIKRSRSKKKQVSPLSAMVKPAKSAMPLRQGSLYRV